MTGRVHEHNQRGVNFGRRSPPIGFLCGRGFADCLSCDSLPQRRGGRFDERHGSAWVCGCVHVSGAGDEPEAGASGWADRLVPARGSCRAGARRTAGTSALCAAVDAEGALSSGALRPVGPRSGGSAAGPSLVPALLRLRAGWRHAGRDHDLPLPYRCRGCAGGGLRGDRPPARRRWSGPAQGHADGCHIGGFGLAAAVENLKAQGLTTVEAIDRLAGVAAPAAAGPTETTELEETA